MRLSERLGMGKELKPMSVMTIRFSGKKLPHVGTAVAAALDAVWAAVGVKPKMTMRGWFPKGARSVRHATPKPMGGTGGAIITKSLAAMKRLPAKESLLLYAKDGDGQSLVPDSAALFLRLQGERSHGFDTDGGFLSFAFPLAALEENSAKWVALGDSLMGLLDGAVATLGAGVWYAPSAIFLGGHSLPRHHLDWVADLFARDPQLDVADQELFSRDRKPGEAMTGLVAPSWVMWASKALAKKVTAFDGNVTALPRCVRFQIDEALPFEMTAARHQRWVAAWASMAPIHLRAIRPQDIELIYFERFRGLPYAALGPTWHRRNDAVKELERLRHPPDLRLLEAATRARELLDPVTLLNRVIGPLEALVAGQQVTPAEAHVWLDAAESDVSGLGVQERVGLVKIAWRLGDVARAKAFIRLGLTGQPKPYVRAALERDEVLKPLIQTRARDARPRRKL